MTIKSVFDRVKKMAPVVALAPLLGGCFVHTTTTDGARLSGISTPVFNATRFDGMDPQVVSANQITQLRGDKNPQVRKLGDIAACQEEAGDVQARRLRLEQLRQQAGVQQPGGLRCQ